MATRRRKSAPPEELKAPPPIETALIVDVETTGLVHGADRIIELGFVLWSVTHRSIVTCGSCVVPAEENPVEDINRIPVDLVRAAEGLEESGYGEMLTAFERAADYADIMVAHNAPFDHGFVFSDAYLDLKVPKHLPWVCTMEDFPWPHGRAKGIVAIALAHGVGVSIAHRALTDCLLIAHTFERISDIGKRLAEARARANAPKFNFSAEVSYMDRDQAKQVGFHWEGDRKLWLRKMTEDEAKELGAEVKFKLKKREEIEIPWLTYGREKKG